MKVAKYLVLLLVLLAPLSAHSVLISTSIGAFDVTDEVILGITALRPEGHPWVRNGPLAVEFAALVGDALGLPNTGTGHELMGGFCDPEVSCTGDFAPLFAIAEGALPFTILARPRISGRASPSVLRGSTPASHLCERNASDDTGTWLALSVWNRIDLSWQLDDLASYALEGTAQAHAASIPPQRIAHLRAESIYRNDWVSLDRSR